MRKRVPSYRHHKGTGQAVVTLDGKDVYLGKYGSPESHQKYSALISEWQANQTAPPSNVTVGQLSLLYQRHAEKHYVKNGKPTSEAELITYALRYMNRVAKDIPLAEFSPRHLKAARKLMIEAGMTRSVVNKFVQRIRRAVKWAVSEELCHPHILVGLQSVEDLKRGRSEAPDNPEVKPVPEEFIDAIQPHIPPVVWALVEMQRWTGMRPQEARLMRTCDLNTSETIWEYRPESHKTAHFGKDRIVFIGQRGQNVLQKWLRPELEAYLFSPAKDGSRPYRRDSYRTAIARGCEKANVPIWTPNQLRHNFATRARREFGIEAARVTLGHSSAVTSEIYAERDLNAARAVVAKIG